MRGGHAASGCLDPSWNLGCTMRHVHEARQCGVHEASSGVFGWTSVACNYANIGATNKAHPCPYLPSTRSYIFMETRSPLILDAAGVCISIHVCFGMRCCRLLFILSSPWYLHFLLSVQTQANPNPTQSQFQSIDFPTRSEFLIYDSVFYFTNSFRRW